MKQLIGKKATFIVEGIEVKGTVREDDGATFVVQSKDDKFHRIAKNKVSITTTDENWKPSKSKNKTINDDLGVGAAKEKAAVESLNILRCSNATMQCSGVKYATDKKKSSIRQSDYREFMDQCPKCNNGCHGSFYRSFVDLSKKDLREILVDVVFGEYPE